VKKEIRPLAGWWNPKVPQRTRKDWGTRNFRTYAYGEVGGVRINEWDRSSSTGQHNQRESRILTFAKSAKVGHPPVPSFLSISSDPLETLTGRKRFFFTYRARTERSLEVSPLASSRRALRATVPCEIRQLVVAQRSRYGKTLSSCPQSKVLKRW
jgi:hypothetical protein